jgi:hypothetical protein
MASDVAVVMVLLFGYLDGEEQTIMGDPGVGGVVYWLFPDRVLEYRLEAIVWLEVSVVCEDLFG